jgi:hypothetical protein
MKLKRFVSALMAGVFVFSTCIFGTQPVTVKAEDKEVYVLMNIPYDEFYEEEINNSVEVDAMSSATKSKTRTLRLSNGSYHVDDTGESIDGVTFAVKADESDLAKLVEQGAVIVTDENTLSITTTNRGKTSTTEFQGKDALYEAPDYSYYVLSEAPSFYKELRVDEQGNVSFSAIQGDYATLATLTAGTDISYDFTDNSSYGDYQLNFDTQEGAAVLAGYFNYETDKIYGVVIRTAEGSEYALRHVENIWTGTKLAWSTGNTTVVHGCQLSFAHYEGMVGQTITEVTYLTEKGKVVINGLNLAVTGKENSEPMTAEQEEKLTALLSQMQEVLADYKEADATAEQKDLYAHMMETVELLSSSDALAAAADELLEELPGKLAAVTSLATAEQSTDAAAPATADTAPIALLLFALVSSALLITAGLRSKKCYF